MCSTDCLDWRWYWRLLWPFCERDSTCCKSVWAAGCCSPLCCPTACGDAPTTPFAFWRRCGRWWPSRSGLHCRLRASRRRPRLCRPGRRIKQLDQTACSLPAEARLDVVAERDDSQVARRWLMLCPLRHNEHCQPLEPTEADGQRSSLSGTGGNPRPVLHRVAGCVVAPHNAECHAVPQMRLRWMPLRAKQLTSRRPALRVPPAKCRYPPEHGSVPANSVHFAELKTGELKTGVSPDFLSPDFHQILLQILLGVRSSVAPSFVALHKNCVTQLILKNN
jgi:hypothetical protein